MATTHKRLLVLMLGALAGMLVAASAAYACASLATVKLESDSAAVGSTVEGRGDAFRDGDGFTDVTFTLESRDGEVLWSGPTENRTVHFSFEVPDVAPGVYAIVGTQHFTDGRPAAGTPARTTIEITPAAGAAAAMTTQTDTSPAVAPAPAEQAPAAAEEPSTFTATQPATASAVEAAPAPAPAAVPAEPTTAATQPAAASSSAPTAPAPVAPATQESAPVWQAAETAAFPAAARASSAGVTLTKAAETAAFPTALRAGADSATTTAAAPVAQPSSAITAMQAAMSTTAAAWLLAAVVGLALGVLLVSRRRQVGGLA